MPVETFLGGKPMAERIHDKLKSSSPASSQRPQDHIHADAGATTNPTRCVTTIYYGASEKRHGPTKAGGN
jgi:hypothetical protein